MNAWYALLDVLGMLREWRRERHRRRVQRRVQRFWERNGR